MLTKAKLKFDIGMQVECIDEVTGNVRWTGVVKTRSAHNGAISVLPDGNARFTRDGRELWFRFSSHGNPLDKFAGCAMKLRPQESLNV